MRAKAESTSSESLQTYANSSVGLTLANYTPTRFVNPCRSVFIRVGISIPRRVVLRLHKTRLTAFKIFSCLLFNEQDNNVKLQASIQKADRKLITSVLKRFVVIAKVRLKVWVAFTTSVPVKKYVPPSLKRILNVVGRRKSSMH